MSLSKEELQRINAYWRAANYLAAGQALPVGQILSAPSAHTATTVKKKIVGHWGTVPGQNFVLRAPEPHYQEV